MNKLKWLYPGIGVKRWILLALVGFFLISTGITIITDLQAGLFFEGLMIELARYFALTFSDLFTVIVGVISVLTGIIAILFSLGQIDNVVSRKMFSEKKLIDVLYEKSLLEKGPRIVSLGGGTGLSNLLRGLKKYTSNITAIVTVADDGGSSGKLREEMGILPPGDIRNCLIALADIEPLMEKLIQYRFKGEGELSGHSFGNLFIASMNEVVDGEFEKAVKESSQVLAIKGQVLPVTNEDIQLGAVYEDETSRVGESIIPDQEKKIEEVFLAPENCQATSSALQSIEEAEVITLGPGSLYTSILPNLMVDGIVEAIKKSSAIKIYICNVMTQPGETDDYNVRDHVEAISNHVGSEIIDYVLVNSQSGKAELRKKYEEEGAYPVVLESDFVQQSKYKIIEAPLLSGKNYLRHDPQKTAKKIMELVEESSL